MTSLDIGVIIGSDAPLPLAVMSVLYQLRSPFADVVSLAIDGGRWVEPASNPDETIGADLWALPGLVDAHAHISSDSFGVRGDAAGAASRAREALAAGVTLIYDKGWTDLTAVEMAATVPASERPDVEAAGVILSVADGYLPGFGRLIDETVLEDVVRATAREGKGWVKLIGDWPRRGVGPQPNFDESQLKSVVAAAEGLDARVAIHTMARDMPSMAVRAGVHSIEHGLFLSGPDLDLLGARGGMWVPTVVQMESVIGQLGAESSGGRLIAEGLENVKALLARAIEAGVRVLTGTDLAIPTRDVAKEAVRLWELGMPAQEVVKSASTAGFAGAKMSNGFRAGEHATVAFFRDDPTDDPRALMHPELVVRHGRVVR